MISATTFAKYAASPESFRNDLTVDVNGVARQFKSVQADWQRADFAALDPGLMRCNGRSDAEAKMRAFYERPRGASKTSDIATMCVWALAFAMRPLRGYCYGADRDQARLLLEAVATIIRLNGWLGDILSIESHRVVNVAKDHPGEGGVLNIEASQIGSSFGTLGSLYVADELCHWPDNSEGLWHSIISSAAKRSDALLLTITNAGYCQSWQHRVREVARVDENWLFSRMEGHPSWIPQSTLDEQRRMLPAIAFARLWENCWAASGGDALTPADIEAAFDHQLRPMNGNEPGWLFVGGLDLGLVRDCSSFVILAVQEGGRSGVVKLAHAKLWTPRPGAKINLLDVERHILEMDEKFHLQFIGFDPWQSEHLSQRVEIDTGRRRRNQQRRYGSQPFMREQPATAANLREVATLTIESFGDRRIQCYDYPPLKQDLLKLRVEEKVSAGSIRLTSPRDASGHGDSFSAFASALLLAHEIAGKKPTVVGVFNEHGASFNQPLDPLARAMKRIDDENAYRKFLAEMPEEEEGPPGWAAAMRWAGRM